MFGAMEVPRAGGAGRPIVQLIAAATLVFAVCACTSLKIERETQTSGTFRSRGWAFTFLSWDLPQAALDTARENVSDARLVKTEVTEVRVTPYLGWFDWLLDILGVRVATIRGTWGFPGQNP